MSLHGKIAIVTGAGRGIGRATSLELAKAGVKLALADISEKSINEVKAEIEKITADVMTVQTDVSKRGDAEKMAGETAERFGGIDILVNNAGIASAGTAAWRMSSLDIDDHEWDTVLATNLKGQFNCSKAVMPYMMKQRSGRIINMGSTTALTGAVGSAAYCASKAGIMALTKVLARELGPYHICVNCVAPGLTLTPMQDSTPPEAIETAKSMIPLGRAGKAVDIARAILFFASDELFATGQTLIVDGGGTM